MIKTFENYDTSDISWNVESINSLIEFYEDQIKELEEELDTSAFPPGVEEKINRSEECVYLLRGMKDKKSWYYKNFNK